jgi:hypothetical protein
MSLLGEADSTSSSLPMVHVLGVVPLRVTKPEELHLGCDRGFDVERNVEGAGPCRRWR